MNNAIGVSSPDLAGFDGAINGEGCALHCGMGLWKAPTPTTKARKGRSTSGGLSMLPFPEGG